MHKAFHIPDYHAPSVVGDSQLAASPRMTRPSIQARQEASQVWNNVPHSATSRLNAREKLSSLNEMVHFCGLHISYQRSVSSHILGFVLLVRGANIFAIALSCPRARSSDRETFSLIISSTTPMSLCDPK